MKYRSETKTTFCIKTFPHTHSSLWADNVKHLHGDYFSIELLKSCDHLLTTKLIY